MDALERAMREDGLLSDEKPSPASPACSTAMPRLVHHLYLFESVVNGEREMCTQAFADVFASVKFNGEEMHYYARGR